MMCVPLTMRDFCFCQPAMTPIKHEMRGGHLIYDLVQSFIYLMQVLLQTSSPRYRFGITKPFQRFQWIDQLCMTQLLTIDNWTKATSRIF